MGVGETIGVVVCPVQEKRGMFDQELVGQCHRKKVLLGLASRIKWTSGSPKDAIMYSTSSF